MTIDNTIFREILLKRGTTAQNSTYTGPVGEVVVDTTLKTLRVQDGVTPGGWPLESAGLTGNLTANTLTITSTTASTTHSNGALIVAGGVGIGGNLNVGSIDAALHNIQGNLVLGYSGPDIVASADTILTINLNNNVPQLAPNNTVHISGADGKTARVGIDSFGNLPGVNSGVYARHARGTSSSPSAVQINDYIAVYSGRGYGSTGYVQSGYSAGMYLQAAENYTDTAQGTRINFLNAPIGSNASATSMHIDDLGVYIYANVSTALTVVGGASVGGPVTLVGGVLVGGPVTLASAIQFANLTTTQVNAITSATTGMTVYNYTTGNIQVYNGSKWANVTLS